MTWQLQQDYKGKFNAIKKILDEGNCKSVLDIGCNAGAITNLFGEAGFFAVGLDKNVDCNGKHQSACIGQFKMDLNTIKNLPKFDAILLLSVLHQIIKENGNEYAKSFICALLGKCDVLMVELAGIRSKYGYGSDTFTDNDSESIQTFFNIWLDDHINCELVCETRHNSISEPKRYLFELSLK